MRTSTEEKNVDRVEESNLLCLIKYPDKTNNKTAEKNYHSCLKKNM